MGDRIRELANLFPKGNCLIDVGSDHGYLGLQLLRSNRARGVLNIDLSKDALDRSLMAYRRWGLEGRARFLVNDGFIGLANLPEDSVAVIAGLGTIQILRILENLPEQIDDILFLSHTGYYGLRKWATNNSFRIKEEKYIEDGDFIYLIMHVSRSKSAEKLTRRDLILGREEFWKSRDRRLFNAYWRRQSSRILGIPLQFRDEIEKETIRYLRIEGVI